MSGVLTFLMAAIQLAGVKGSELRARAFFDANNVKVGDPIVLTIDFIGTADFKDLHPPALAKSVDHKDWKVDDASAKTDTFRDARRLTYRVRPMREGVLWFPAIEFAYEGTGGQLRLVRANAIPVHSKGGAQVVVEEMSDEQNAMPQPPDLMDACALTGDDLFHWRKAMAKPSADAFAAFDFPAAKMNEAACAIREGNWARAMKIYQKLEWRIGQTPAMEKGIVAALALRYDNPAVELPVWRQVLRPILRYGWTYRVGIVVGGFGLLALVFWLLGRGLRAVACVTFAVGFGLAANAQDPFQQMEEEMNRMRQRMQQAFGNGGGFNVSFGGMEQQEPVKIVASVRTDKKELQVGDPFAFIVTLEYPRSASVGQIRLTPSESFGLQFTGQAENLADGRSANPSNVVKRLVLPARYDIPYRGQIAFSIDGMVSGRQSRRGGAFNFTFSNSFRVETDPIKVEVKPLATAGQPADFGGIVSEGLRVHEACDLLTVETNDVVTITYRLFLDGYVPEGYLPKDAAFEWTRRKEREGTVREIEYRRYFVASGEGKTPEFSIPYYDPRTKSYKRAKTGGTVLTYK